MTRGEASVLAATRYETVANDEVLLDMKFPERILRRAMLLFHWHRWREAREDAEKRRAYEARLPPVVGMSKTLVTIREEMISLGVRRPR